MTDPTPVPETLHDPSVAVDVLLQALPYIQRFRDAVVVVKFGGNAMSRPELFADFARGADLDQIEVVATSAVRDAENRDEVLERLAALGLPARILPGSAEAEYGTLAVANSTQFSDAWVADMGGGSVQVSRMEQRRFIHGDAYPLGALRLSEQFLGLGSAKRGATTAKQVKQVEKVLQKHLGKLVEPFSQHRPERVLPVIAMDFPVLLVERQFEDHRIVSGHPFEHELGVQRRHPVAGRPGRGRQGSRRVPADRTG